MSLGLTASCLSPNKDLLSSKSILNYGSKQSLHKAAFCVYRSLVKTIIALTPLYQVRVPSLCVRSQQPSRLNHPSG